MGSPMIVLDQSELIRAEGRVQSNEIFILQMEEKLSITFSVRLFKNPEPHAGYTLFKQKRQLIGSCHLTACLDCG